jgi:hypothetical protein
VEQTQAFKVRPGVWSGRRMGASKEWQRQLLQYRIHCGFVRRSNLALQLSS